MREVAESAWRETESLPDSVREQIYVLPRMPIEIIACPLGKEVNHGGILRIAEAFRLERVTFAYEGDQANDFSGNRGALKWQPYRWLSPHEALEEAKDRQKIALTLSESAVNFETVDFQFPVTLLVGSEAQGIPQDLVAKCDLAVAIPMFGLMGSLNVATATAVVVQRIASQYARLNGFEAIRDESKRLLTGDPQSQ
jgi:tRNA G18 (ribose-2'-O)-methylase SpoU